MLINHDGEFKLWQREWLDLGPPPAYASHAIDEWLPDSESAIGDAQVHPQLRRTEGHRFPAGQTVQPDQAVSTVHALGFSRRCMIILLPQLFSKKLHDLSDER